MSIQVTHRGPVGQTSESQPGWTVTRGLHGHPARVSTSTDAVLRLDLSPKKTYSSGQTHTLSICLKLVKANFRCSDSTINRIWNDGV
jgi:hypothetical protein